MHPQDEIDVEVFRAGNYGQKGVYTTDDLKRIATDYNPTDHEAPVTIDHQQNGPADGWVRAVRCVGDVLVATLHRLSPRLCEAIKRHAFKKRSIELYRKFTATERPYLKAVSFLGAAAPEVKGLADPSFSETVSFEETTLNPAAEAQRIKEALIAGQAWDPRWEEAGLLRIFEALAGREELTLLHEILSEQSAPITFESAADQPILFAAAIGDSLARHQRALEELRRDPSRRYRDVLLGDCQ